MSEQQVEQGKQQERWQLSTSGKYFQRGDGHRPYAERLSLGGLAQYANTLESDLADALKRVTALESAMLVPVNSIAGRKVGMPDRYMCPGCRSSVASRDQRPEHKPACAVLAALEMKA